MLIYVPINQIDDNPFQARQEYGDIADLAARIAAAAGSYPDSFGLMQIPRGRLLFRTAAEERVLNSEQIETAVLKLLADGDKAFRVQLAFGHRRLRAFRHLHETGAGGYDRMPVHVDALSDDQMLDAVWAENRERKDISAVEEAELLRVKVERLGSQAAAAEQWGLARSTIANRLRLLELPAGVQQANREGRLSERQALALKPLIDIEQLAGDDVEWGNKIGEQWGDPAAPDKHIEYVLANPDAATSDTVREMAGRLLDHAGKKVPGWLATAKFEAGDDIVQAQCKGCEFRINQHCLRRPCLDAKAAAWPAMALADFSAETGIPISDQEADFELSYNGGKALIDQYAAGNYDGLVIRWLTGRAGARPIEGRYVYEYSNIFDYRDGRDGIVLGCRGGVVPDAVDAGEEERPAHYDRLPNNEQIEAWSTALRARIAALQEQIVAQIDAHLATAAPETMALLAVLCEVPAPAVAKHLWNRYKNYRMNLSLLPLVAGAQPVFAALGLEPLQLTADDSALTALTAWYNERRYSVADGDKIDAVAGLQAAWERAAELSDDLAAHVLVALQDAQWWYGKNAPDKNPFEAETAVVEES